MQTLGRFVSGTYWPMLLVLALAALLVVVWMLLELIRRSRIVPAYEKRKTIFDTVSEHQLFSLLQELFVERFYVFPQVHYSHIVAVDKRLPYQERFRYWQSINRKSADFVLCDKEDIAPLLVIELDGSSHEKRERQERDRFVNNVMKQAELPILHLRPEHLTKEHVRSTVEVALGIKGEVNRVPVISQNTDSVRLSLG